MVNYSTRGIGMTQEEVTIEQAGNYFSEVASGKHDVSTIEGLDSLMEKMTLYVEVIERAGLADKYDEAMGGAAERYAILDAVVYADSAKAQGLI